MGTAMEQSAFVTWLDGIDELTEPQRRQVWQALALSEIWDAEVIDTQCSGDRHRSSVERAVDDVRPANLASHAQIADRVGAASIAELGQRRVDSVGCPHCDNRDVVRWGQASALPRYRCKACSRTFNALTKTPLANLRMKEKWATQTAAMIDGVSTAKAARRCDVHYTTAFRWRHRFLASLAGDKPKALAGIVEGDETFILESFKGKRSDMPRKSRKRGGKSAKRGLSAEQIAVIVARDRQGATTDAVLPKLNRVSIAAALGGVVTPANEMAERRSLPSRAGPASQPTFCQCRANQIHKRQTFISTTSMPTTAG
jgi:transposase-like protein